MPTSVISQLKNSTCTMHFPSSTEIHTIMLSIYQNKRKFHQTCCPHIQREWVLQPPQRAELKDAGGTFKAVQNIWESIGFTE